MTAPRQPKKSSRRQVNIEDAARWVFNRMADVYDARPDYPVELIDAIAELAGSVGKRIGDLGAGIGHLAIPLAERGFEVTAIEPARAMLDRLEATAVERGASVRSLHAAAEALPVEAKSFDVILIADALHFIDSELAAREIARVLVHRGLLIVVTCELGDTPFMRDVARIIEEATQRRPRQMVSRNAQLSGVAKIPLSKGRTFTDETPVTRATLERILGSISFVGPAMNPERTAAFHARVHALAAETPIHWARKFTLQWGRRWRQAPSPLPRNNAAPKR
jgi:ubiquinone/menaquinone biosynthesis C-methylase UbiE